MRSKAWGRNCAGAINMLHKNHTNTALCKSYDPPNFHFLMGGGGVLPPIQPSASEKSMSKHYCYMIRANQHIKIGYSRNVEKRMEAMQTGNQYKLELVAKLVFETELMARQQEKDMHKRYKRFHFRGEWFFAEPVLDWLREYGDAPKESEHELDILADSPIQGLIMAGGK